MQRSSRDISDNKQFTFILTKKEIGNVTLVFIECNFINVLLRCAHGQGFGIPHKNNTINDYCDIRVRLSVRSFLLKMMLLEQNSLVGNFWDRC